MKDYSVQIYCEGNSSVGFGHLSRSLALYYYFLKKKLNVSIYGTSKEANNFIGTKAQENTKADLVIIDSNNYEKNKLFKKLREKKKTLITLDCFGSEVPDINIVVYAHHNVKAINEKYIGFKYIILRREFLKLKKNKIQENTALICIGGGDILSQSEAAASILHSKGFKVTIISGPTNNSKSTRFNTLANPINFAKILSRSEVIITNGGGTMFESIFLKKITIALPQTNLEMNIANYALKYGSIFGIGLKSINEIDEFKIKNFSFPSKNLIDGKGVSRIFKIINNLQN
jgi:spore coat polysaccharide biosynthesis predicted glycosyltransferase SpsG|tara:strand:- start:1466 stop:2329 length:864 start_codon:yes stop_codon:yes gene_type:complete